MHCKKISFCDAESAVLGPQWCCQAWIIAPRKIMYQSVYFQIQISLFNLIQRLSSGWWVWLGPEHKCIVLKSEKSGGFFPWSQTNISLKLETLSIFERNRGKQLCSTLGQLLSTKFEYEVIVLCQTGQLFQSFPIQVFKFLEQGCQTCFMQWAE